MNLKIARKLDYYIGIPLCFFISVILGIKRCFCRSKNMERFSKKIIFIGISEMGSALLSYPAMTTVKEKYRNSDIYFWIFKENSEALRLIDFIPEKNIIVMRSKNILILFKDIFNNIRKIRKENIDTAVDLELFSRTSSILSYLSGAETRVGFYKYTFEGLYRGNFYTHKVMYNPYYHISKNFISLIDSLEFLVFDIPMAKKQVEGKTVYLPKVNITDEKREKIWNKLKARNELVNEKSRIIVINVGFGDLIPIRRWPLEYYLELVKRINKKNNVFIVLVGVFPIGAPTLFSKCKYCIDITGKTAVSELLDLFNVSNVLVSYDCGIVHIASLTNIYIIALFGPETPLLYGPLTENKKVFYKSFACSPCLSAFNHRKSLCMDNKCMRAISVDEVYSEVAKALGEIAPDSLFII